MKRNSVAWIICGFVVLVLAASAAVLAGPRTPAHFSGVINDYSPSNVLPMGPWEIRGPWSLQMKGDNKADFSASLTMELSDYTRNSTNIDNTATRMQHTHHITIEGGTVTPLPTGGFEVSGPVSITKDGSPAPLAASMLYVDITGGTTVEFSDITLKFDGGATVHFGLLPIHGVVRAPKEPVGDAHH